ncbi:MAG: Hpt domain-containing protein, partial [Rhodoferax sp.]
MDITEFYQTFFEEADELLAEMELLLLGLDLQAPDSEHLNAIFRAAHSIKGGAATFGFLALTDTTHLLENLLDRARHGQLTLSTKMMDAFLETKDVLQKQMSAYRAGAEPEPDMVARICAVLRQLAQEAGAEAAPLAAAAPPAQPVPPLVAPPDAAAPAAGSTLKVHISKVQEADRRLLGEELGNLGRVLTQTQTDDSLTLWLDTTCDA